MIAHTGGNGVDQSFVVACGELGIAADFCPVEYAHAGDFDRQHQRLLAPEAQLCVTLARGALDERLKDLTMLARSP
jgi:hypothetical protein